MRRRISVLAAGLLLLGWVGLGALSSVSAVEKRRPPLVGYLVRSEGKVELKRPSWKGFHRAGAGTRLERQDQLRLGSEARAVVLCADFETIWQPTRGERNDVSHGCRQPTKSLTALGGGLAIGTRGPEAAERIRSPRGAIRDPTPLIRWGSFGAQQYEVQVSLGTRTIWGPVLVAGTEQQMPPGFLEPERPYRVQVRPVRASVFVEPTIPFHLIAEGARSEIAGQEANLLARFRDEESVQRVAQVLLLAHQHLWDEALALLDTVLPDLESAAAESWGGHLAVGVGLQRSAVERFEKARNLAREQGDLEAEAAACVGLGRVVGKREQADKWLKDALVLYQQLGDESEVESLKNLVERLP